MAMLRRPRLAATLTRGRNALQSMVRSNRVLRWAYAPVAASLPLPPARLMHAVQNTTDPAIFAWGGLMAVSDIRAMLFRNGLSMTQFARILDFGCGSGRVIRHWRTLPGRVEGTDYNAAMIEWCERNLPFGFTHNGLDPPLAYPDRQFDFIYAFSVFTHLDAPRQLLWINELRRVLQVGGHLLLTTHGTRHLELLDKEQRMTFERGELVVKFASEAGTNTCLAFHPEAWVRSFLGEHLELVDYAPWGAANHWGHDMYLFRNRAGS
jgi:SAM-dependent methyltransferase